MKLFIKVMVRFRRNERQSIIWNINHCITIIRLQITHGFIKYSKKPHKIIHFRHLSATYWNDMSHEYRLYLTLLVLELDSKPVLYIHQYNKIFNPSDQLNAQHDTFNKLQSDRCTFNYSECSESWFKTNSSWYRLTNQHNHLLNNSYNAINQDYVSKI